MRRSGWILLLIAWLLAACQQAGSEPVAPAAPSPTRPALASAATATLQPPVTTVESAATVAPSSPPATATPSPAPDGDAPSEPALIRMPAPAGAPGALVGVTMPGRVGVLLDELPPAMRDRVAEALLAEPEAVWQARAARQVRMTKLRLNFRNFDNPGKGQLPLPPAELWQIALDPTGPRRQTEQGHDLVLIDYVLETTLLTDPASLAASEPALAEVGGVWEEPFIFPLDPDQLLQRTGNACVNEGGFPPHSYDSENVWHFYDFTCEANDGGALGCHRSVLANFSCREALALATGETTTAVRLQRLPWDPDLADRVRIGPLTSTAAPDLMVVGEDLAQRRLTYTYITAEDCALEEGAVGAPGWRRLLRFDATVHNVGGQALHVGAVVAEDAENHVFEYSLCHDHFHYSNYGTFFLQEDPEALGSKQAFCVQSTSRYSNNELSPLTHGYSCRFQGIQAGWVDEYVAGLDAQWIDVTDVEVPPDGRQVTLGFGSNQDRFLCEGTPVRGQNGEALWEPTGLTTADGHTINRPQCEFVAGWEENNEATVDVFLPPSGSFVTGDCTQGELGPRRNCGLTTTPLPASGAVCAPGESVSLPLDLAPDAAPQVARVCEWSAALGAGVACTFEDAVANAVVTAATETLSFTCPAVRDAGDDDPAGQFSLYSGPLWPADAAAAILP